MGSISIMIVDNDLSRADSLAEGFTAQGDIKLLSAVAKRETALRKLSSEPDVILLHDDMSARAALVRFLNAVHARSPKTRMLLLLSTKPEDEDLIDCIRSGARGYLPASSSPALIAKAVRAVAAGEIWAERRLLEKNIAQHALHPENLQSHVPNLQPLTSREMDMLSLVMKGATNREIAEMSNISERTVKTHLYRVYRKLKVKSRTKAIALLTK
ncbi:MAG: LuxR C-terminal-related transcriptional regulator [Nitrospirota bacterium]